MNNPNRSLKDYALITLKGMGMGAADVVPGVSGGTIAFITGIYDELLSSLRNCNPAALLVLKNHGIQAFWQHINGNFLIALFGGVLISLKTFAALIEVALANKPVWVWSFFFGLIIASVVLLVRHVPRWRLKDAFALIVGAAVVAGISVLSPGQLPGVWWIMFLGGFVAICAMILPGISGSFLLLLAGLYPVFIGAINDLNWLLLITFASGAACGLMTFSRFLSWLLHHYHQITVATLIGFLVGSLNVVWPWKLALETTIDRHGEVVVLKSQNVLPSAFAAAGNESSVLVALTLCVAGIFLVLATEWLATKFGK